MKYARLELERRFLVERVPDDLEQGHAWRIIDRYITNTHLRLRRMEPLGGGETIFKFGQKQVPSPPDFGRMIITNIYLSPDEYAVLGKLAARELHKRRYPYTHAGRRFGVDIFEGDLTGLVLAETDFESSEEMDAFVSLPAWIARDVSHDVRFTGGALSSVTPDRVSELIA